MPTPRPFGVGPYGAGLFSTYAGNVWAAGARSGIKFTQHAVLVAKFSAGAAPRIRFTLRSGSSVAFTLGGRSGITFAMTGAPQITITLGGGFSQITFSLDGVLVATWAPAETPCPGAASWVTTWAA
jgi:hypothetical protein